MGNKTTQTGYVFSGKPEKTKKKSNSPLEKIITGVAIGLLVLWIWNRMNEPNHSAAPANSNQEQMEKDRAILEKEKG